MDEMMPVTGAEGAVTKKGRPEGRPGFSKTLHKLGSGNSTAKEVVEGLDIPLAAAAALLERRLLLHHLLHEHEEEEHHHGVSSHHSHSCHATQHCRIHSATKPIYSKSSTISTEAKVLVVRANSTSLPAKDLLVHLLLLSLLLLHVVIDVKLGSNGSPNLAAKHPANEGSNWASNGKAKEPATKGSSNPHSKSFTQGMLGSSSKSQPYGSTNWATQGKSKDATQNPGTSNKPNSLTCKPEGSTNHSSDESSDSSHSNLLLM